MLIGILSQVHSSTDDFDFFSVCKQRDTPSKVLSCEDGIYMHWPGTTDPLCQLPCHPYTPPVTTIVHIPSPLCLLLLPLVLVLTLCSSESHFASPQACCRHYSFADLMPLSHVNDAMHNIRNHLPIKPLVGTIHSPWSHITIYRTSWTIFHTIFH